MSKNTPYHLIHRDISGQISPSESKELHNWLREDSSNEEEFDATIDLWNDSLEYKPTVQFSAANAFQKLKNRIDSEVHDINHDAPNPSIIPINTNVKSKPKIRNTENPIESGNQVVPIKRRSFTKYAIAASLALMLTALVGWNSFFGSATVELIASAGQKQSHALSDGTVVQLFENSSLTFEEGFSGNSRKVNLKGKAYFDVAKDAKRPFKIDMQNSNIEVLGTQFMVDARDDNDVAVYVEEGKVRFTENATNQTVVLVENESATFVSEEKQLKSSPISTRLSEALDSGVVAFTSVPLSDVFTDLEKYYNVNIEYDTAIGNVVWSTTGFNIYDNTIDDFLNALKVGVRDDLSIDFTYKSSKEYSVYLTD